MSNWERREINNLIAEDPEEYKKRFPKPFSAMIPDDASAENKLATVAYVDAHSGGGGGGGGQGNDPNAVHFTQQSLTEEQKTQARTNIGAGTYSKPQNGIPPTDLEEGTIPDAVEANPTVPAGTTPMDLTGLKVGNGYYGIPQPTVDNTPTANSNNLVKSGGVYDAINPSVQSSQPAGGFAPNVVYDLGTLTGMVTFALASPTDNTIPNAYHWTFDTGSTAPTITWPSGIVWPDGFTPSVDASKHYEVLVRNGYASMLSYSLS